MKLQIFDKGEGRYVAFQKQRTGADDGSPAYETVQVGEGWAQETPDGETYIDLKVEGFTDAKPK